MRGSEGHFQKVHLLKNVFMWLECALEEKGGGEGSKNDAENKTVPLDEI